MSTIQEDLADYLQHRAPISALLQGRVYPDQAPEDVEMPFAIWQLVGTERPHHLGGASGISAPTFRFDVFADFRAQARQVVDALRLALDGYKNLSTSDVGVQWVEIVDDSDDIIQPSDGSGQGIYTASVDFTIWHRERVPVFPAD